MILILWFSWRMYVHCTSPVWTPIFMPQGILYFVFRFCMLYRLPLHRLSIIKYWQNKMICGYHHHKKINNYKTLHTLRYFGTYTQVLRHMQAVVAENEEEKMRKVSVYLILRPAHFHIFNNFIHELRLLSWMYNSSNGTKKVHE